MSAYIKREDAISLFEKICDHKKCANVRGGMWCNICAIGLQISELRNKPAEDVAPVVYGREEETQDGNTSCSNCGVLFVTMYIRREPGREFGELVLTPNYCPNCGALMEGR